MDLELHSHSQYSFDSLTKPEDIIAQCRIVGIDRIAITDHNEIQGALSALKLAPDLIIVGEEVMTTQGELLCYFIKSRIPPGMTPADTCDLVHQQGGLVGPSHPFDPRRSGLGGTILRLIANKLDFVEVFNARTCDTSKNDLAYDLARDLNLPMICASDAHTIAEIGRTRVRVQHEVDTPASFLRALSDCELITSHSSGLVSIGSRAAALAHVMGMGKPGENNENKPAKVL